MKTYEKPKLIALSISGNDLLCGCLKIDDDLLESIYEFFGPGAFAASELFEGGCSNPVDGDYEFYCKFTSENNFNMTS